MRKAILILFIQAMLVAGLVITGGTITSVAQETENPFTTRVDVRMGGRRFRAQCGRCHSRDATGNDETGAPDLTTGTFRHASTDAGLFRVIREGIDGTAMIRISPDVADQTVWQIVSFIDSLNQDPEDIDLPGNATAGQQVFNGKGNCANCHMVNGKGGRLGSDLSTVGNRRGPDEIKTDVLAPNEEVDPRWWTMKVTREDGSIIEGIRMNEDTFSFASWTEARTYGLS